MTSGPEVWIHVASQGASLSHYLHKAGPKTSLELDCSLLKARATAIATATAQPLLRLYSDSYEEIHIKMDLFDGNFEYGFEVEVEVEGEGEVGEQLEMTRC